MEFTDLVAPDRVIAALRVSDKSHLLTELARHTSGAVGIPASTVRQALETRERLGSTGVGAGIAIPHAQITGLDRFYGLFVRLARRIDYDAIDRRPVDLIFLLLIPTSNKQYIEALACISRRLRDQVVANKLRSAKDGQDIYEALTEDHR